MKKVLKPGGLFITYIKYKIYYDLIVTISLFISKEGLNPVMNLFVPIAGNLKGADQTVVCSDIPIFYPDFCMQTTKPQTSLHSPSLISTFVENR